MVMLPLFERLKATASKVGIDLELVTGAPNHPRLAIRAIQSTKAPAHREGYALDVDAGGVKIHYREVAGLRAGIATLRQLLAEYGKRLPRVRIKDYPDFQ